MSNKFTVIPTIFDLVEESITRFKNQFGDFVDIIDLTTEETKCMGIIDLTKDEEPMPLPLPIVPTIPRPKAKIPIALLNRKREAEAKILDAFGDLNPEEFGNYEEVPHNMSQISDISNISGISNIIDVMDTDDLDSFHW